MSSRPEPFVNGSIYHIYNHAIAPIDIFDKDNYCDLFLKTGEYYRSNKAKISYSKIPELDPLYAKTYFSKIYDSRSFLVRVIAYCLMPNHFHLILMQSKNNGIVKFISNLINSFTRFYNLKNERKGPVFLPVFKSVKIANRLQFIHSTRYVHLNPYSSGLVENYGDLIDYRWSSFGKYVKKENNPFLNKEKLLEMFDNDNEKYKNFVLSNAEYQKTLELIKYSEKWR